MWKLQPAILFYDQGSTDLPLPRRLFMEMVGTRTFDYAEPHCAHNLVLVSLVCD